MSTLSVLGQSYSLNTFAKLIFSTLGSTSIVILVVSFIGLIAYVSSIPKVKSIVTMDPKLNSIRMLTSLITIFFIPVFIWLFIYESWQFFLFIVYILIPVISFALQLRFRGGGWTYLDFVQLSMPSEKAKVFFSFFNGQFSTIHRKILSNIIQAFALVIEIYLFAYFSPTFSLIIWLYFVYFFTIFTIEVAYHLGELLSVLTCDYNKFILKDKVIEGFVVSRDQDHYYLMTQNGALSIFTSNILEMSHLTPSELGEWKKKNLQQR